MNNLTFKLIAALLVTFSVAASEPSKVSTEGYCILFKENVSAEYLTQYATKLGFTPKKMVCRKINQLIEDFQPRHWNYRFGQPYPGSAIRLPKQEIELIVEAQKTAATVLAQNE